MKSRYVLTEKAVEPHEIEVLKKEGLLLDDETGELLKAKARHVMKGYSEANAENLESTTPQVAKDTVMFTLQMLASHQWKIGHLDFTPGLPFRRPDPERAVLLPSSGRHPWPSPTATTPTSEDMLWINRWSICMVPTPLPGAGKQGIPEKPGRSVPVSAVRPRQTEAHRDHRLGPRMTCYMAEKRLTGKHMEWLRSQYKMGKYTTGNGKFTGKTIEQQPSGAIPLTPENLHRGEGQPDPHETRTKTTKVFDMFSQRGEPTPNSTWSSGMGCQRNQARRGRPSGTAPTVDATSNGQRYH